MGADSKQTVKIAAYGGIAVIWGSRQKPVRAAVWHSIAVRRANALVVAACPRLKRLFLIVSYAASALKRCRKIYSAAVIIISRNYCGKR